MDQINQEPHLFKGGIHEHPAAEAEYMGRRSCSGIDNLFYPVFNDAFRCQETVGIKVSLNHLVRAEFVYGVTQVNGPVKCYDVNAQIRKGCMKECCAVRPKKKGDVS